MVLAAIGGYVWWRQARDSGANEMLASAIAVYDAPVVPITAPAPGSPAPLPQAGTFTTEQEKLQAALPKFREAADRYPNSTPGLVAKYHLAGILAALGQYPEAEQRFQEVVSKGTGSIYARTARLGLADAQVAQGKYDNAIQIYTELSRDTTLADAGGRRADAARTRVRPGRPQGRSRTNIRPDRPGVPAIELPLGSAAGARGRAEVLTFGSPPHALAARSGVGMPSRCRNKSVVYFPAASVCSAV